MSAEAIELIGPHAFVDAHAEALDALFPCSGLGDLLRDYFTIALREAVHVALSQCYAASGASDEVEFYGGDR